MKNLSSGTRVVLKSHYGYEVSISVRNGIYYILLENLKEYCIAIYHHGIDSNWSFVYFGQSVYYVI